ncbi:hypothetical protein VTO42DRAFT_3911 [Malbranchea cinnamomea]
MRSLQSNTDLPSEEPSAQTLFNCIREEILNTNHAADLTFQNIPPSTGFQIATSFSEDAEIRSSASAWLSNELLDMVVAGFLTIAERKELKLLVGTTFPGFATPYTSATKEPDACILPGTLPLPTVVVETGWSESCHG